MTRNSFRWQNSAISKECVFEEGMITTDEPGIYIEGKYGIRTENELVCHKVCNGYDGVLDPGRKTILYDLLKYGRAE